MFSTFKSNFRAADAFIIIGSILSALCRRLKQPSLRSSTVWFRPADLQELTWKDIVATEEAVKASAKIFI